MEMWLWASLSAFSPCQANKAKGGRGNGSTMKQPRKFKAEKMFQMMKGSERRLLSSYSAAPDKRAWDRQNLFPEHGSLSHIKASETLLHF